MGAIKTRTFSSDERVSKNRKDSPSIESYSKMRENREMENWRAERKKEDDGLSVGGKPLLTASSLHSLAAFSTGILASSALH